MPHFHGGGRMRQIYIMKKAEDIHEVIRGLPSRAARKASVIQEGAFFAGRMGEGFFSFAKETSYEKSSPK